MIICPECGTPYHRNCYSIENKCIYEDRHNLNKSENLNESAVSKETSEKVKSMMQSVVTDGTGGHGAVAGYSIGGKTGTSEPPEDKKSQGYVIMT